MSAQAFFPGGGEAGPTLWQLNELSGAELQGRFRNFLDAHRRILQVPCLEFERLTPRQIAALQHGYLLWEIVKANDLQGLCVLFRIAWRDNNTPEEEKARLDACLSSGATVLFETLAKVLASAFVSTFLAATGQGGVARPSSAP